MISALGAQPGRIRYSKRDKPVIAGLTIISKYATSSVGTFGFGGSSLNISNTDNNCQLLVTGPGIFSQGVGALSFRTKNTGTIGIAPTSDSSVAADIALSRISAGVFGIGTGAQGATDGTLNLTTINSSGIENSSLNSMSLLASIY